MIPALIVHPIMLSCIYHAIVAIVAVSLLESVSHHSLCPFININIIIIINALMPRVEPCSIPVIMASNLRTSRPSFELLRNAS